MKHPNIFDYIEQGKRDITNWIGTGMKLFFMSEFALKANGVNKDFLGKAIDSLFRMIDSFLK